MSKATWTSVLIQDLVDKGKAELKTGPFGTQLHASDYVENGTPVINVRNIGFGNIREEKLEFLDDTTVQRLKGHLLEPGDIVFGRKGAVDRHAYIQDEHQHWFQGSDCLRLRIKTSAVDTKFVSYYLLTDSHKEWMFNQCSHGATMASLNQAIVGRISLPLPPLPTQRKIAAVLLAYDDLIENNSRRIAILEAMAHLLYREWFVEFRYPGHESVPLVESELGPAPEGWEVMKLRDLCELVNYGYTAKAQPEPIGPKFLRITDIVPPLIDWTTVPHCEIDDDRIEKFLLREGDIVIARTGATVGYAKRIGNRHPKSVFASYLVRLRVKEEFSNFMIGLLVESDEFKRFVNTHRSGAAQPQANAKVLTSLTLVVPPKDLQDKFDGRVRHLFEQKELLQQKNATLRQTRDLLLPRLISGELDVADLDIADENVIARP